MAHDLQSVPFDGPSAGSHAPTGLNLRGNASRCARGNGDLSDDDESIEWRSPPLEIVGTIHVVYKQVERLRPLRHDIPDVEVSDDER